VSVIRLLIHKNSFDKAIELIDSLGRYDVVPNYMYRRVRDLLLDAYSLVNFEQFQCLVNKLLTNNYLDPSSIVLSLIVRKSYQDNGPLQAFETIKNIFVQYNNLVGMFPIIRKLLRDDCTEELKQVNTSQVVHRIGFYNITFSVKRRRTNNALLRCLRYFDLPC